MPGGRDPYQVIVQVFLCAYTGLATGLVRVVILLVITLVSLQRLQESVMPAWIDAYAPAGTVHAFLFGGPRALASRPSNRFLQLDAANKSYKAMVVVHHMHNSPVAVCFRCLLQDRVSALVLGEAGCCDCVACRPMRTRYNCLVLGSVPSCVSQPNRPLLPRRSRSQHVGRRSDSGTCTRSTSAALGEKFAFAPRRAISGTGGSC